MRRATARFNPGSLRSNPTLTAHRDGPVDGELYENRIVFCTLVAMTSVATSGAARGFLPAVEGMRACAAIGVVITHVAFQTGHTGGVTGRLLGRFDLAVAVFFALSGFLLWRGHAAAARGLRSRPPTGHYLRSRLVRIMPGYIVSPADDDLKTVRGLQNCRCGVGVRGLHGGIGGSLDTPQVVSGETVDGQYVRWVVGGHSM